MPVATKSFRWGILDSPILRRELRTLLRSRRSFFWLTLYLVAMLIALTGAWSSVDLRNRDVSARMLFFTIIATQTFLFSLLAPILTAGSLAGEHERRTFELLSVTPLSGYHVVLAKCFSALCYVILLIIATIPILAITFLLGGVGWIEVVTSAIRVLLVVLVCGMAGVTGSAWVRRTYLALMLSLGFVIMTVLVCPCSSAGFFSLAMSIAPRGGAPRSPRLILLGATVLEWGIQTVIFLGLMLLARSGYLAGSRVAYARPKRIIRNPVVLEERRRRYPYYLIDPLAAPSPISDRANPMYVKDKRHQPLGRLDFVIRISYICLFISIFIGLSFLTEGDYYFRGVLFEQEFFDRMLGVSHLVVATILIAAPLFASTAFTTEKEHGTFVPMMTTLVSAPQIVWAKLAIILRYSLILIAALFIPAFGILLSVRGGVAALLVSLVYLLPFYILVIAASGLVGLLISALSRRNVVSMTVTYLVVAFCCLGPLLVTSLFGDGRMPLGGYSRPTGIFLDVLSFIGWAGRGFLSGLGSLLSPFCFLSNPSSTWLSARYCYDHPEMAAIYVGFWAAIIAMMFLGTVFALQRSLTGGAKRQI